jgi:hypothetical protein
LCKTKIKFKEIEILVFSLKPKLSLTPFYLNTKNISEATGYVNFLADQKNSDLLYIYANFKISFGKEDFIVNLAQKDLQPREKILLFVSKKEYFIETLLSKIKHFNRKKLKNNANKLIQEMNRLSDIYI